MLSESSGARRYAHCALRGLSIIMVALISLCGAGGAGAAPVAPHQATPRQVRQFVALLSRSLPAGETAYVSRFTRKGRVIVTTATADGSFDNLHALWVADVDNDGMPEYVWTTEGEGSGHYDYFDVYRLKTGGKDLEEVTFPMDGARLPSNLDDPPVEQAANGITYLNLEDIWAEDAQGRKIYSGANSNAARGLAALVIVRLKYRWDKSGVTLVYRQTERTTYDVDLLGN